MGDQRTAEDKNKLRLYDLESNILRPSMSDIAFPGQLLGDALKSKGAYVSNTSRGAIAVIFFIVIIYFLSYVMLRSMRVMKIADFNRSENNHKGQSLLYIEGHRTASSLVNFTYYPLLITERYFSPAIVWE